MMTQQTGCGIKLIVAKGVKGDGLVWRGEWNSTTTYANIDVVSRGGASWVSKRNGNIGHDPLADDGIWWDCMVRDSLAEAARDKAKKWAENPVDVEVEAGKYSALHHASKAAGFAAAAFGAAAPPWSSSTTYSYPDVVAFTNGHTYRCIGTNISGLAHAPNISGVDNTADWTRITVQAEGFLGIGGIPI